ncbi:MAG TPA: hypothetical protein PLX53_09240, partial [Tenuifilaceae bacterium]|nr:hypothetical protein [Tenuifilaceae bacterium]
MVKVKYHFNPHTLKFDAVSLPFYKRLAKILIHLGFYLLVFVVLGYGFSMVFDTPIAQGLKRTNSEYSLKYEMALRQMQEFNDILTEIEQKDNNIYRAIFECDSIPFSIRRGGYGGSERYSELVNNSNSHLLVKTFKIL